PQTTSAALPVRRTAAAAATTVFFAVIVLSVIFGNLFHSSPRVRFEVTMLLALSSGILSLLLVTRTLERWQQTGQSGRNALDWRWFQFLAVIAWVTALPVIAFGLFFLRALVTERSWHPAFEEAMGVPLTWLGSI